MLEAGGRGREMGNVGGWGVEGGRRAMLEAGGRGREMGNVGGSGHKGEKGNVRGWG